MKQSQHVTPAQWNALPLIALLTANAISMVGNVLVMVAIPWFVLQTTESAAKTGSTAVFTIIPTILSTFFGGPFIDRLDYKRVSIIADLASGVAVALIPLMYSTIGLEFWQLLILVFLGALLDAPGDSARKALIPDLVTLAGMNLDRVNGIAQAIERGARLVGAPLAGILIALIGTSNLLWIDTVTFAVSALLVALLVPRTKGEQAETDESYMKELGAGFGFIRHNRLIFAIIIIVLMTNFLDAPLFAVIMPVFARQVFGSAVDLGLMIGAWGLGSLVGALLYSALAPKLPRRMTFIGAFIMVGGLFWGLAMLPPLPVVLAVIVVAGVAAAPLNPIIWTVLQSYIPPTMRGRVIGVVTAGVNIAVPLGVFIAGYLIEWIGLRATLLLQAMCYLLVTGSMVFNTSLHEMDRSTDSADVEAAPQTHETVL